MRISLRILFAFLTVGLTTQPALAGKRVVHSRHTAWITHGAAAKSLIPAFARKYKISCAVCHAPVPKLTATGEAFAGNGFEFEPGEEPRDTVASGDPLLRLQNSLPLAMRFDAYTSVLSKADKGETGLDLQTPWVIKLLSGGQVSHKVSYYAYFLLSERGEVAGLEDAYLQFTDIANSGLTLVVGQFQVSDPLFKREIRLSYDDYQPYRLRVGKAIADLTYDRGVTALYSPWEGGDLTMSVVTGRGLNQANSNRQFDGDNAKNVIARFSQDIGGNLRVGAFTYVGSERQNDRNNSLAIWGPDATLSVGGKLELNVQYLSRRDDDPFYGTCSVASPCPGGKTTQFSTTVKSGFLEGVISPQGPAGRFFISGLYNWATADQPVISLRLGEQAAAPGYLTEYRTASAALHYLYRRNIRIMGEALWDLERERGRFLIGLVSGF